MNLRINACRPSFGIISPGAVEMAKEKEHLNSSQIKKLVESQEDNYKYHIIDTVGYDYRRCYAVTKGTALEYFKSLASACNFADTIKKAAKENGAIQYTVI